MSERDETESGAGWRVAHGALGRVRQADEEPLGAADEAARGSVAEQPNAPLPVTILVAVVAVLVMVGALILILQNVFKITG